MSVVIANLPNGEIPKLANNCTVWIQLQGLLTQKYNETMIYVVTHII